MRAHSVWRATRTDRFVAVVVLRGDGPQAMPLKVREYRESDAEVLAGLFFDAVRQGARDHYSREQREAWAPSVPDTAGFASRLAAMTVLVAEDETGVLGFMALDAAGCIDLAFVRPDRIGTGVASRIYTQLETVARASGQRRLFSDASELAKPFFKRHGWTVCRQQTVERRGVELTNYRMQKWITGATGNG
jgi:putative acetyltransferase